MQSLSPGIFSLLTALAALGASAAPVAAATYRNEVNHFQVEVPPGWRAMTDAELKAFNDSLKGQLVEGNPIVIAAGFLPEKDKAVGARKIIIQPQSLAWGPGNTRENIEKQFVQEVGKPAAKSAGDYAAVLRDAGETNLAADWGHNRLVYSKVVENGFFNKKTRNVMAVQFCKAGRIDILCCSPTDSFDADLPAFQVLNDSFAVDDGFDFKPPSAAERVKAVANLMTWIMGCVCFGVVVIIVLVIVLTRRHNRHRQRRPRRRRRPVEDDEEEE